MRKKSRSEDDLWTVLAAVKPGRTLVCMVNSASEHQEARQHILQRAKDEGWSRGDIVTVFDMVFGGR